MSRVRIDKWLWAARFFKTRTLATKACDLGRVEAAGQTAKPARELKAGETLHIKTEAGDYCVEVLGLSEMRGPAAVAQLLYRETDASREARLQAAADRKAMNLFEGGREGRPSKRDRRRIIQFRDRG